MQQSLEAYLVVSLFLLTGTCIAFIMNSATPGMRIWSYRELLGWALLSVFWPVIIVIGGAKLLRILMRRF